MYEFRSQLLDVACVVRCVGKIIIFFSYSAVERRDRRLGLPVN